MWHNRHLKKSTKISIYRAVDFAIFLYGSVIGHLLPPLSTSSVVPLALPPQYPQHPLKWFCHQYWRSWKAKIISMKAMLLKSQVCWTGHVFTCSRSYSADHCDDRRAPKKWFKNCLKKSLVAYHIALCQWSTLIEKCNTWCLTINHVVSPFVNFHRAALKDKRHRKRDCNTMSSIFDLTFSSNCCDHSCLSHIALMM